jgi:hypothetical protein
MVAPHFGGITSIVWISAAQFSQHLHSLADSRPGMPTVPDAFGDFNFLRKEFGMLTMFAHVFVSVILCNLKTVVAY